MQVSSGKNKPLPELSVYTKALAHVLGVETEIEREEKGSRKSNGKLGIVLFDW
jgi:hypothetical protein